MSVSAFTGSKKLRISEVTPWISFNVEYLREYSKPRELGNKNKTSNHSVRMRSHSLLREYSYSFEIDMKVIFILNLEKQTPRGKMTSHTPVVEILS